MGECGEEGEGERGRGGGHRTAGGQLIWRAGERQAGGSPDSRSDSRAAGPSTALNESPALNAKNTPMNSNHPDAEQGTPWALGGSRHPGALALEYEHGQLPARGGRGLPRLHPRHGSFRVLLGLPVECPGNCAPPLVLLAALVRSPAVRLPRWGGARARSRDHPGSAHWRAFAGAAAAAIRSRGPRQAKGAPESREEDWVKGTKKGSARRRPGDQMRSGERRASPVSFRRCRGCQDATPLCATGRVPQDRRGVRALAPPPCALAAVTRGQGEWAPCCPRSCE